MTEQSNFAVFPFPPSQHLPAILRLPQVKGHTGLSRSSIYAGIKAGTFPSPVKLGERAVGWTASSIEAWVQSRVQATFLKEAA